MCRRGVMVYGDQLGRKLSCDEDQISMEAPHDIVQKEVTMHFKFERMEKNVVYLRK